MVLTPNGYVPGAYPWEIVSSRGTDTYLSPDDPQYNTRGEDGYYPDTMLGYLPTDAEQAICYTPVKSGWIETDAGYLNPPWVPPDGWTPAGPYKAPISPLSGEGPDYQKWGFVLGVVSTAALVVAASAHVYNTLRKR